MIRALLNVEIESLSYCHPGSPLSPPILGDFKPKPPIQSPLEWGI